jgi:integrative and conjugative element protein (TIGR02256 family)
MPHVREPLKSGRTRIGRIVLEPAAAEMILKESRRSADGNETGGVLLGDFTADGSARVPVAGGPGPAAVHRPAYFLRDLQHAQRLAAEVFADTGSEWIGEWHTHPGADPIPSTRDLNTYLGFLADPELRLDAFVTIIVTPAGSWHQPQAHGWVCYPHLAESVPLTVSSDSSTDRRPR